METQKIKERLLGMESILDFHANPRFFMTLNPVTIGELLHKVKECLKLIDENEGIKKPPREVFIDAFVSHINLEGGYHLLLNLGDFYCYVDLLFPPPPVDQCQCDSCSQELKRKMRFLFLKDRKYKYPSNISFGNYHEVIERIQSEIDSHKRKTGFNIPASKLMFNAKEKIKVAAEGFKQKKLIDLQNELYGLRKDNAKLKDKLDIVRTLISGYVNSASKSRQKFDYPDVIDRLDMLLPSMFAELDLPFCDLSEWGSE